MTDDVAQPTSACVVGGGPAGAMLGLLLARAGVDVVVLEKHADFHRDFRGDTVHPASLQALDEIGLTAKFKALNPNRTTKIEVVEGGQRVPFADFSRLRHPFPYIAFVPQWDFLSMVTTEAARYPNFRLLMKAEARDLVYEDDRAVGVRFSDPTGDHTIRAALTVAADGRHSTVREAAGLVPRSFGSPMEVVMFRISRRDSDPDQGLSAHIGTRKSVGLIDRGTYWQISYEIPKGDWGTLRAGSLQDLRDELVSILPFLADRVEEIRTFDDLNHLEVRIDRLRHWQQPGLLFIGDAAHAMSPVGGFGVNLALQDAVAVANLLAEPLRRYQRTGAPITNRELKAVWLRRWLPTAAAQKLQRLTQDQSFGSLQRDKDVLKGANIYNLARFGFVQRFMAHMIGVGLRPEHVRHPAVVNPER